MALQSGAIESRLAGLKLDDHRRVDDRRSLFDSKLRAFRAEDDAESPRKTHASNLLQRPDPDSPIDQTISLIKELSRRVDILENKERTLAVEMYQKNRQERHRWTLIISGGVIALCCMATDWIVRLF